VNQTSPKKQAKPLWWANTTATDGSGLGPLQNVRGIHHRTSLFGGGGSTFTGLFFSSNSTLVMTTETTVVKMGCLVSRRYCCVSDSFPDQIGGLKIVANHQDNQLNLRGSIESVKKTLECCQIETQAQVCKGRTVSWHVFVFFGPIRDDQQSAVDKTLLVRLENSNWVHCFRQTQVVSKWDTCPSDEQPNKSGVFTVVAPTLQ
jgi:hypothetical protein